MIVERTRIDRPRPTIAVGPSRPRRTLSRRFIELFPVFGPWLVLATVIAFLWPVQFGGVTSFSIVSGRSMERTYHTGDLVITKVRAAYKVGEIVVYKIPGTDTGHGREVVHRLHTRLPDGTLLAQGDNNKTVDPWTITDADIVGAKWLMIPKAGVFLGFLRSPAAAAILIGALVMWVAWPRRDDDDEPDAPVDTVRPTAVVNASVPAVVPAAVAVPVVTVAKRQARVNVVDMVDVVDVAAWHWLDDDGVPDVSGSPPSASLPSARRTTEFHRVGARHKTDDWLADARIEAEFPQFRDVRPQVPSPPNVSNVSNVSEQSAALLRPAPEPANR